MDGIVGSTVRKISSLQIRGARGIAIAALKALKIVASRHGFGREFMDACDALEKSRPTAVPLHNVIKLAKEEKSIAAIDCLIKFLSVIDKSVAASGAEIVKNNMTILTHCHSSEAIALLKFAKVQGKKFRVIVTETRPKLQGLQTAKDLIASKIPVDYVVDSAASFYAKDIDIAVFGCDSIRKEGIYNKIGTYMMALACRENKIPVYFAGDSLKVDRRPKIEVEMRPADEVIAPAELKGANIISFRSASLKAFEPGLKILNPAFDCTPWKLVSGLVTEEGTVKRWNDLKN